MNVVELRQRLIGLHDAKAGKLGTRSHNYVVGRVGCVVDIAKDPFIEGDADGGEKGTGGHLHIEVRKPLCAGGEDLVVGRDNALLRNFDQAAIVFGLGDRLIESESFLCGRVLLRAGADTHGTHEKDRQNEEFRHDSRGNPQMLTWVLRRP